MRRLAGCISRRRLEQAHKHKEQPLGLDNKKRQQADTKNRADQMVYETEKGLREYGDRLDSDAKAKVEASVARVKEALKTSNLDEIKSATEALTTVWHQAAGKMYQQSQASAGAQTHETTTQTGKSEGKKGGEGEPVDADYEVVN